MLSQKKKSRGQFSGLRFGKSYKSGVKIKEVSTVFTLTSQKTEIAKSASEPKLQGLLAGSEAAPRAEKFGDLITADHKILNEGCESRDNHRYAVVVQELATQWIQSYPCKTKTSHETQKSLLKFLEATLDGIWESL